MIVLGFVVFYYFTTWTTDLGLAYDQALISLTNEVEEEYNLEGNHDRIECEMY